jgi:hypothetical protein
MVNALDELLHRSPSSDVEAITRSKQPARV